MSAQATTSKLTFSQATLAVQIELSLSDTLASATPPKSILGRAQSCLEGARQKGTVTDFRLFEARLVEVWSTMLAMTETKSGLVAIPIKAVIAQGIPAMPGIKVLAPENSNHLCTVTIEMTSEVMRNGSWRILEVLVVHFLEKNGATLRPNLGVLNAVWIRGVNGENVQRVGIPPAQKSLEPAPAFTLSAFHQAREIVLNVFDPSIFASPDHQENALQYVRGKLKALKGWQYQLMSKGLTVEFERAANGPERLGIGLPASFLVAHGVKRSVSPNLFTSDPPVEAQGAKTSIPHPIPQAAAKPLDTVPVAQAPSSAKSSPASQPRYPGSGLLTVLVTKDRMSAVIEGFKLASYQTEGVSFDEKWLDLEMKRLSIVERDPKLLKRVIEVMRRQRDPNGLVVAMGSPGKPAEEPFLAPIFKVQPKGGEAEGLRRKAHYVYVKKGDEIAEIRFQKPAEPSRTIFGETAEMPEPPPFEVVIGEGVEEQGLKFLATIDGIPLMTLSTITVSVSYTHEGDVNLKSGDIEFNGPLTINGSVEHGATVLATGDVMINGSVEGGTVKTKGNLFVMGISNAWLSVGGDLKAHFIENSSIEVKGDIESETAILNCRANAGGFVRAVQDRGMIAGGTVVGYRGVDALNLGYPGDVATFVKVGVPWRKVQRIDRCKGRLKKLRAVAETDRRSKKELAARYDGQATKRHGDINAYLNKRLTQIARLKDRLESWIAMAKGDLRYEDVGTIYARENLRRSCHVQIGENELKQLSDLTEAAIVVKGKSGCKITAIADAL